jgi:hypothetical protein
MDLEFMATDTTPYVYFNSDKGIIRIVGKSILVDPYEFYDSIIENVRKCEPKNFKLDLYLSYINTKSSIVFLDLFKSVKKLVGDNHYMMVDWYYDIDDEDMLECGEDYAKILKMEFNFISKIEEN